MTTDQAIQRKFNFRGRNLSLPWHMRHGSRNHLAQLFGELGFKEGVEIGTCRGSFSTVLCQLNPNLHLTCVDPWMEDHWNGKAKQDLRYAQTVERLKGLNATIVRKTSLDAVAGFADESLDFAYIDANHTFDFYVQDLIAWTPKVKKEGIIAAHDYHSQCGPDVMMVTNAYTHCHDIRPWYVTREEWPTAFWVKR